MVVLPGVDAFSVELLLDRGTLLLGDADPGVRRRVTRGVEREAGVAEVRDDRMSFCLDDPGAEDALVELGGPVGIG